MPERKVRVTQTASRLGRKPGQKETLIGLGLNKMRRDAGAGGHARGPRHDPQGRPPGEGGEERS